MDRLQKTNLNNILQELEKISSNNGDVFKSRAYKRAAEVIMLENDDELSLDKIKKLNGVGKSIIKKLEEFVETGVVKKIEDEKNNPVHKFSEIYGVGPKKALLLSKEFSSIEELRMGVSKESSILNDKQKIGLKHYENILERIPRNEIDDYNVLIKKILKDFSSNIRAEIVGSYRRGAETSGDIDIIITSNNETDFDNFINKFDKNVVEYLGKGKTKCFIIGQLQDKTPRRIDFMFTSEKEFPFAILYFTGSKEFNVRMRQHALSRGFTLNEHEIKYSDKTRYLEKEFSSEEDIFKFLGMKYKIPSDRTSGNFELLTSEPSESVLVSGVLKSAEPILQNNPEKVIIEGKLKVKTLKKVLKKTSSSKDRVEYLSKALREASDKYYNGIPIITDQEFDSLQDELRKLDPNNKVLKEIGAPIKSGKKIQLPYFMPSMDKVKKDTLDKWLKNYKNTYVLTAKLDGVSGLYIKNGSEEKLYTRGNGSVGSDISHLLKLMPPFCSNKDSKFVVRGELIISDKNFEDQFSSSKANARNTVSGLISQKNPNPEDLKFIDFVSYEVIEPSLKPSEQLNFADKQGLNVVKNENYNVLSVESVSKILIDWRHTHKYTIDGIIIAHDKIYDRTDSNPKHSVAFKMVLEDQKAQAKVIDVKWAVSKHGLAKPVIHIEPTPIGGVVVRKISGQNAKFIVSNKIGKGALIEVVRRGDVIPYAERIITPADKPTLPDVEYEWTDTNVDIIIQNYDDIENKQVIAFFTGFKVDGIGEGTIQKLRNAGYKDINSILKIKESQIKAIEGMGDKSSSKIYKGLQELQPKMRENIPKTMALSGKFGRGMGSRKINEIFKKYPDVLKTYNETSKNDNISKINLVPGFSNKSSELFNDGFPKFIEFSKEIGIYEDIISQDSKEYAPVKSNLVFIGKSFVFTGFRDEDIEKRIINLGGDIKTTLSTNTYALIIKDSDVSNSKTIKANDKKITIYTKDEIEKIINEIL
tara:strand:- start:22548 stop:25496 length:2949 start_codon:yes stop_codon:yes gene_type:complete